MHGYGDRTCRVIAVEQCFLQTVWGHSPVVAGIVGYELQLVAEAPHDDRRVVAVATYPLRNVILPTLGPVCASSDKLSGPFVIDLVDDQNAIFVTQVEKRFAVGVVGGADVVEAEVLEHLYAFFHRLGIGGRTEGTERVVVGDALEQDFLAIELHAIFGRELDFAYTEVLTDPVGDRAVGTEHRYLGGVEIGILAVPQFHVGKFQAVEAEFSDGLFAVVPLFLSSVVNLFAVSVGDAYGIVDAVWLVH